MLKRKAEQDATESESDHSVPDNFSTVVSEAFHEGHKRHNGSICLFGSL